MAEATQPPLLALPTELLHHILSYLDVYSLADVLATCRTLRDCAKYDQLWHGIVEKALLYTVLDSPATHQTFRHVFTSLHPYWFIPRNKIWFADRDAYGRLLIARYDARRGCIDAYPLTARRDSHAFQFWQHDPGVVLHSFSPRVGLDLNEPALKLDAEARSVGEGNKLQKEIMMEMRSGTRERNPYSMLMLCRPLAQHLISPGTKVWPPHTIPGRQRTRNNSIQAFTGLGHKPNKLSEASDSTFRIRKVVQNASRTSGPLAEEPWRGIWVGDYAGHGCEFLVIIQPDEPGPLPTNFYPFPVHPYPLREPSSSTEGSASPLNTTEDASMSPPITGSGSSLSHSLQVNTGDITSPVPKNDNLTYHGRLEAIKLTGDPNIPRGEYTFIAPDIGEGGLIRIATEEPFCGARIVRSRGHVAQRGFRDDEFISSQLILISSDRIAQYWENYGHVSMYRRVNIDDYIPVQ